MAGYTTVSARIETDTKLLAEEVLHRLGISQSAAISALYSQIVLRGGLPFALELPQEHGGTITLGHIKRSVSTACSQYGVARAWLFGSYARGEASNTSDVDLLIEKGGLRGMALGGFIADLEQSLGRDVDVVTLGSEREDLAAAIAEDKVLLYERE